MDHENELFLLYLSEVDTYIRLKNLGRAKDKEDNSDIEDTISDLQGELFELQMGISSHHEHSKEKQIAYLHKRLEETLLEQSNGVSCRTCQFSGPLYIILLDGVISDLFTRLEICDLGIKDHSLNDLYVMVDLEIASLDEEKRLDFYKKFSSYEDSRKVLPHLSTTQELSLILDLTVLLNYDILDDLISDGHITDEEVDLDYMMSRVFDKEGVCHLGDSTFPFNGFGCQQYVRECQGYASSASERISRYQERIELLEAE